MEEQVKITDDILVKTQGFIRNLTITERGNKDSMYKFQIRYIDNSDLLVEPNDWYSGFGKSHGVDGDYIIFKYKVNGIYKNVKEVIDVKFTHEELQEEDKKDLKEIDEPTLTEGEVIIPKTELSLPYYALLLTSTINLCIKKGNLSDEEIKAQYNRFIKMVKSNEY